MVHTSVLLRFANNCEHFNPYFIKATSHRLSFHALKKYSDFIISTFSDIDCTVIIGESFDQNCYYYVIQ